MGTLVAAIANRNQLKKQLGPDMVVGPMVNLRRRPA
jgi:hypothetical protein